MYGCPLLRVSLSGVPVDAWPRVRADRLQEAAAASRPALAVTSASRSSLPVVDYARSNLKPSGALQV